MSLEVYAAYLTTEKRMTDNTKQAYLRDLRHFSNFAEARGIDDPAEDQQYGYPGLFDGTQNRWKI